MMEHHVCRELDKNLMYISISYKPIKFDISDKLPRALGAAS